MGRSTFDAPVRTRECREGIVEAPYVLKLETHFALILENRDSNVDDAIRNGGIPPRIVKRP